MNMNTVLKKTTKGREELDSRRHGLDRALRPVLILIDGESTLEQVLDKAAGLPNVAACLAQLELQGYISRKGYSAQTVREVKLRLAAIAREVLGRHADKIVAKLDAAPDDREGLLEVVRSCKKMVALLIDEGRAEELQRRCQSVLEGF